MKIEHLAIWTRDLEKMRLFYTTYFDLQANKKYHNPAKNFSSYFLTFGNGARIELMYRPDVAGKLGEGNSLSGLAHFAISLGSKERVDSLTELLGREGYKVLGLPRVTGDGYYESLIEDPEGNQIELTV